MTTHIQINVSSDDAGNFTEAEQRILNALSSADGSRSTVFHTPGHTDAPAEGFTEAPSPSDDQQKVLDDVTVPEPEKPKRKRRTKAEMEADRQAEEGSTGAVVLEPEPEGKQGSYEALDDLGDVEAGDAEQEEKLAAAEAEADAIAHAEAAGHTETTEDLLGGEEVTPKQAYDIAVKLLGLGKTADIKKALDAAGVERASHVDTPAKAQAFVDALPAEILALAS